MTTINITEPPNGLTYNKRWRIENGRVYDVVDVVGLQKNTEAMNSRRCSCYPRIAQEPRNATYGACSEFTGDDDDITHEYAKINSVYEKHKKSLMNSSRDFFHLVLHISSTAKMYDFVVKYIVPDSPTKKDMKKCEVVRIFSHKVAKKDRLDRQISYERLLED